MSEERLKLHLSPITRLGMTFARELAIDKSGTVFNEARYRGYLAMYAEAIRRRDNLARSVVFGDFLLLILLSGKSIIVPGISLAIIDLPAALEITLVFAAVAFLFASISFFNEQAYLSIVSQFHIRRASQIGVDPDFLLVSDVYQELFLKLYRRKLNIWGIDFLTPGRSYVRFFGAISLGATLAILVLISLHFVAMGAAIYTSCSRTGVDVVSGLCWSFAVVANVTGLLTVATMTKDFEFTVTEGLPAVQEGTRPEDLNASNDD